MRQLIINVPMDLRDKAYEIVEQNIDNDVTNGKRTEGMSFCRPEGHLKWSVTSESISVAYIRHLK